MQTQRYGKPATDLPLIFGWESRRSGTLRRVEAGELGFEPKMPLRESNGNFVNSH